MSSVHAAGTSRAPSFVSVVNPVIRRLVGELVRGVRYFADSVQIESIVMRSKSGTIRVVDSLHQLGKLRAYSAIDFDRPT